MAVITEENPVPETVKEAYDRFWQNYLELGGRDATWFEIHVQALLKIAIPGFTVNQRPVYQQPPITPARRASHSNLWNRDVFIDFYTNPALDLIGA